MYNEFEKDEDNWRPDPPKWTVITKKALSYAFGIFVVAIIGFLVVRMLLSQPPRAMKQAVWNDTLYTAYQTEGNALKLDQISTPSSFSESSMMSVYTILYCPSVKQLQVTVRFNDRLFDYLAEDYPEVKDMMERGEDLYVFNLTYRANDTLVTVKDHSFVKDEKGGYTYYRLIFENITLEGVANMTVNACYVGRPNTPEESVTIYSTGYGTIPFDYKTPKGVTKGIRKGNEQ